MFRDKRVMKGTSMLAVTLHNMVSESRSDEYESDVFKIVQYAPKRGMFSERNGVEGQLKWRR